MLNTFQDANEAASGQAVQVTVATNMAGRGTEIHLGATVANSCGLHVLSHALNDERRLDRRLATRAARLSDPSLCSYNVWVVPIWLSLCSQLCVGVREPVLP